jgi:hypothetical protein
VSGEGLLPQARFLATLDIVRREGGQLAYSWNRLFAEPLDRAWVLALAEHPELAERLEAFVSRYGRMQDTIGEKLLPRWLLAFAETPGSLIETLNRAERLGVLGSVERWLEARKLRNKLVHEYMTAAEDFVEDLMLAKEYSLMFFETYNQIRDYAGTRMGVDPAALPDRLSLSGSDCQ